MSTCLLAARLAVISSGTVPLAALVGQLSHCSLRVSRARRARSAAHWTMAQSNNNNIG